MEWFWIGLLVYGLFLIVGWFFFIRNDKQDKLFTIGALIYGLWVGEWRALHSPYIMKIQEYGGYQRLVVYCL